MAQQRRFLKQTLQQLQMQKGEQDLMDAWKKKLLRKKKKKGETKVTFVNLVTLLHWLCCGINVNVDSLELTLKNKNNVSLRRKIATL